VVEIVDFCVGRDLMGSDNFENAAVFDEQGGGTHGIRRYDAAGKEGAKIHSERRIRIRAGEILVRMRTERRLISAGFQVSKIDNSSRKKCWVVVWRAYTCRLARASGWLSCRNFGTAGENARGIGNEGIGGDKT
jgi:hypothetical protein